MEIQMIVMCNGNDSLQWVEHQRDAALEPLKDGEDEGVPRLGPLKERADSRIGGGAYFLSKEEVDVWDKDA